MALNDHIETLKGKPHHVRKRVAFGIAGGSAALIGILWFGISLSSGAYAIHASDFADATAASASVTSAPQNPQLAGAAAALDSNQQSAPAHIQIIDDTPSAHASTTEATIIPF